MALPKIDQPLFDLVIPSTKSRVKFRPFTVKEEKVLLIAQESKETLQTVSAIKQIINNCVQDDIDVDRLAIFDLEYILINIRSKSVSNEVSFTIRDGKEEIPLTVDLDEIKVIETEGHSTTVRIRDNIALTMRYPDISSLAKLVNDTTSTEDMFDIMLHCIDMVAVGEEVYVLKDNTKEEQIEFVESLTSDTIQKIKDFFDTMPTVKHEIPYTLKDGTQKVFTLKGLDAFFI
jgi:hypothetical protein